MLLLSLLITSHDPEDVRALAPSDSVDRHDSQPPLPRFGNNIAYRIGRVRTACRRACIRRGQQSIQFRWHNRRLAQTTQSQRNTNQLQLPPLARRGTNRTARTFATNNCEAESRDPGLVEGARGSAQPK